MQRTTNYSTTENMDIDLVNISKKKEINGWSKKKQQIIEEWRNDIEYQYIVNWFFLYELKKSEGFLTWAVIVISTITSAFSLIELDPYIHENWMKGATTTCSIFTTLAVAYIKKENYIDRIKNVDRHLHNLLKLKVGIDSILSKMPWDRMSYESFIDVYEDKIVDGLSDIQSMSPEEFKKAVWTLTKYYPELINNVYPWYKKDENGEYYCTEWGGDILRTYEAVYYSKMSRKILCLYYCRSKCSKTNKDNIKDIYKPYYSNEIRCSIWPKNIDRDIYIKSPKLEIRKNISGNSELVEIVTNDEHFELALEE